MSEELQQCSRCKEHKPKEEYPKSSWKCLGQYCKGCVAAYKREWREKRYYSDPVVIEVREKRRKELQVLKKTGFYRGMKETTFNSLPHTCSACGSGIPHPSCIRFYVGDEDKTYIIERGTRSVRDAMIPLLRPVCLNCHAIKKWEDAVSEYVTKKRDWEEYYG